MDSTRAKSSSVETLAIGESTEHYQQYARVEVGKFYKHDRKNYITISALVLVAVDSVGNLIYPTMYQEMTGYPISLSVAEREISGSSLSSGLNGTPSSFKTRVKSLSFLSNTKERDALPFPSLYA